MSDTRLAKSVFRFSGTIKAFALAKDMALIRSVTRSSRLYTSQV